MRIYVGVLRGHAIVRILRACTTCCAFSNECPPRKKKKKEKSRASQKKIKNSLDSSHSLRTMIIYHFRRSEDHFLRNRVCKSEYAFTKNWARQ